MSIPFLSRVFKCEGFSALSHPFIPYDRMFHRAFFLFVLLLFLLGTITQGATATSGWHRSSHKRNIIDDNDHHKLKNNANQLDTETEFKTQSVEDSVKRSNIENKDFKSSSTSNIEWAKSYGSISDDSVQALLSDTSQNIYLTGIFQGNLSISGFDTLASHGGYDFFVMRMSQSGTVQDVFSFGGVGDDAANAMNWGLDGNLLLVGKFSGNWTIGSQTVTPTSGTNSDIFILNITPQGDLVWISTIGGPGDDNANDIGVLTTGGLVVVGSFQLEIDFGPLGTIYSNGKDDILVLWMTSDGQVDMIKNYGSTENDEATGVAVSDTNVGVCGVYNGDIVVEGNADNSIGQDVLIVLYDTNGTYVDMSDFNSGLDDGLNDVLVDTFGNVYVVGYYTQGDIASVGGRDIVVVKFTETASFLYYRVFGGPEDDVAYSIGVDKDENLFIVGYTGGGIDFGNGVLESQGGSDIFLVKLDSNGNAKESYIYGGVGNDTGRAVVVINGVPVVGANFDSTIKLGSSTFQSVGGQDMVVFPVGQGGSGGSKKSNAGVIAAAVIVPIVVLSAAGAIIFVVIRRRNAYRKKMRDLAAQSEIHTAANQNNYQPVSAYSENMSNQSLVSHNSSNQSLRTPESNYTAIERRSDGNQGLAVSSEFLEMMKSQGINDISNSSWLIDFKQIQLQQNIGHGAFGAVFKGIWRGVPVAVKQANSDMAIQDFLSEAEILQKLRPHPNITQFLGVCPQPFCLIFEFVPNGSLFSFLMDKSKKMDNNLKIRILRGVVAGMIHLHSEGIVHRDLAARNILLDGTFTPKVCDFGLSRATGGATVGHTASEIGPIKWMAPEAILKRIYSPKTDVWSFGVVIFEVLERSVPYPDLSVPQVAAYITQISLIQSIPENNSHPPALIEMIQQCLQVDPNNRPSFEELIAQFDQKLPQEEH